MQLRIYDHHTSTRVAAYGARDLTAYCLAFGCAAIHNSNMCNATVKYM